MSPGTLAATRRPAGTTAALLPWLLGGAGVLLQVGYPLLSGEALRLATVGSVLLLAAAGTVHAWLTRGGRWALGLVAGAAGLGLLVEAVGVATGVPFGSYAYAGSLGAKVLGVPLLVPMAWLALAYPALLAGRVLAQRLRRPRLGWLLSAWTLASWDLFLDPQMVAAGHWTWAHPEPGLPGSPGVPLTNYAGWLAVAAVMMVVLDRLPRRDDDGRLPHDALPVAVLAWTYASQLLANLVFFDRPWVAAWGGVAMGLVVLPWAAVVLPRDTRRGR